MDVLTSETCWAVDNKASVIKLVNLYSNTTVVFKLRPQIPRHFAWKPTTPFSQTLRSSCFSHVFDSCYVGRPIMARPPLCLHKHTDLRAHEFAHSPDMWHQPRLDNFTCAWSWSLCGITPDTHRNHTRSPEATKAAKVALIWMGPYR